ncbi:transporter substrate-binding domain-containing protein [Halomonas sp. ISL-60]|uniref:transporter substrate-binding domain-containing protein n=1 Tax=Halomonas sp. ISL-56 TaxID=2819149 RepID=UPI001BE683E0|nr:transporter substrate-binding domain-containing protein [Halomonas sp. ISL-56]MBT2771079.1 transporter substrate-binding domain-containing protein [Halomonas sp. ISL-60]MBT2799845.1 transporter substrate-binding domain-containing protein [Halomonas sp. ISL-56]
MFKTLTTTATLIGVSIFAAPALADSYKIGLSAEPYPPFYSPDAAGNWSGWEIDFIEALCDRLDAECEIKPVAWEGIIPALKTGKIDMIIGSMSITPERAEQIAFSDKYYASPTGIVALKDSDVEPTPEGVEGAYLGIQSGTNQEQYARTHFADTANLQVYQTLNEELQDLVAGRLDAVVADTLAVQTFINSEAGNSCCEYRGAVPSDPELMSEGMGVGLRQEDTELKDRVNAAIDAMRADGTYETITAPYFDFDIYGS